MNSIQKSPKAVPYIFIVLLAVIAFWPTLKVGFMWDDHEMIEKNPTIQSVTIPNIVRAFKGDVFDGKGDAYFRPLQTLFNMADHAVWGLRPFGYHLTNLLLHISACLLLFVCLRRVFNDEWKALIIALLFSVHPIIVEQLLIIAGRAELMAAVFTFAALALAFQKSTAANIASVVFCFLACLSKESGVAMPFFLALAGWFNPKLRVPAKRYIVYFAAIGLYFFLRSRAVGPAPLFPGAGVLVSFLLKDFPTIIITYLRILIFPYDLHSHRCMVFYKPWMFLSPLILAGFIALCIIKKWRWGLFSAGWFLIGLAPKIPLLAVNSLMLDHWAYLSGVGLFIVLVHALRVPWAPFVFLAFWLGLGHWNIAQRNTDYKLYTWALKYPSSSIVRYNLGVLYYQNGDYASALAMFQESLNINPDFQSAAHGKVMAASQLGSAKQ